MEKEISVVTTQYSSSDHEAEHALDNDDELGRGKRRRRPVKLDTSEDDGDSGEPSDEAAGAVVDSENTQKTNKKIKSGNEKKSSEEILKQYDRDRDRTMAKEKVRRYESRRQFICSLIN